MRAVATPARVRKTVRCEGTARSVGPPTPTSNSCPSQVPCEPLFYYFSDGPWVAFLKLVRSRQTGLPGWRKMQSKEMQAKHKTMIVTGASQGIGAGVTKVFLERGYNIVANSRNLTKSAFTPGKNLALVDGNIGHASTAERLAEKAMSTFGSIDGVVNNAGIFFTKTFTDFTADDFRRLSETNLEGYVYITQLAVKQMLAQKTGGRVTFITSAMVEHPIAGVKASIPMITKGGLEAITRSLAMEYAREGIRFNAVAPGVVDTPLYANDSKESTKSLSPIGMVLDITQNLSDHEKD